MDNFTQAFEHNFYLTPEYAGFCSRVARIPLEQRTSGGHDFFTLKNKNISISNYPDSLKGELRQKKVSYLAVMPEINANSPHPSMFEYSLLYKTTYEEASKNYKTSFFHGLREGKKIPHQARIVRRPDAQLVQNVYSVYQAQMRRHNSFVFPLSFFEEFLSCPSALLLLLEYEKNVMAYFCCFQYEDNIYASIGGGNPRYFSQKSSNKLYDELIKYACSNQLNIHLGIGEHGSGYQNFKRNAGLVNYKTERFPDDEGLLKLMLPFTKFKITGLALALFSRLFPHLTPYLVMPFT